MDEGIKYYLDKMDSHKKTSYLFEKLPFYCRLVKSEMIILFAIFFIVLGIATKTIITSFILFMFFSTEYSRIFNYREKILEECLINEEMHRIEMLENGVDPNFPDDPLYITQDDRAQFFSDALSLNRSYHIFRKLTILLVYGRWIKNK